MRLDSSAITMPASLQSSVRASTARAFSATAAILRGAREVIDAADGRVPPLERFGHPVEPGG